MPVRKFQHEQPSSFCPKLTYENHKRCNVLTSPIQIPFTQKPIFFIFALCKVQLIQQFLAIKCNLGCSQWVEKQRIQKFRRNSPADILADFEKLKEQSESCYHWLRRDTVLSSTYFGRRSRRTRKKGRTFEEFPKSPVFPLILFSHVLIGGRFSDVVAWKLLYFLNLGRLFFRLKYHCREFGDFAYTVNL